MSYIEPIHGQPLAEPARFFLALMLHEVRANATDSEERAFLNAVGRDLATCFPLAGNTDLAALEGSINDVWRTLDIGSVRIHATDDAVLIRHQLPRTVSPDTPDQWTAALPAILEGAYDAWLRTLGSGPRLRTWQTALNEEVVEFRHGL